MPRPETATLPTVSVRLLRDADSTLLEQLNLLIPQLSTTAPALTPDRLRQLLDAPDSFLFVAQMGPDIVGSLCLHLLPGITGTRAFVEDVVVAAAARQRGVGEALMQAALAQARHEGARTVDLTCRPERAAANRLYLRLGFRVRATNFYRLEMA